MPRLQSNLIIGRCPHCSIANPNLTRVHTFNNRRFDGSNLRCWAIYECKRCGGVVTASAGQDGGHVIEMFPNSLEIEDSLPEKAKAFLQQAVESLHAPSGAIMLAASSIDSMLKEKGYKSGKLYGRINKAAKDHLITSEMAKWAHEVRLDANNERHADEAVDLPDSEDAQKTVNFAIALAEFLFVLPARIKKGIEDAKEDDDIEAST